MWLVMILALLALMAGRREQRRHQRNLEKIKIRVHVNGSRGKSTVTRLIAAGLRAGGLVTVAKTTGTAPRFIYPDGHEEPIQRRGPANIREQIKVVSRAVEQSAEALVIECMAVQPELQRVCEQRLVQATVGVITNVRPDHLDEMGPTLSDVARSLALTMPRGRMTYTAEDELAPILVQEARARQSELCVVGSTDVPSGYQSDFPYWMFPENLALALQVCTNLGVAHELAYQGMIQADPDPGVLRAFRWRNADAAWTCVNAFAANDPESTRRILDLVAESPGRLCCIVNLRADRPRRTLQYLDLLAGTRADKIIVVGGQRHLLARLLARRGVAPQRIASPRTHHALDIMGSLGQGPGIVIGIGNIDGTGERLVELWSQQGEVLHGGDLWSWCAG